MNEGSTKPAGSKYWSLKESQLTKFGTLVIVAVLVGTVIGQKVVEYREIRQLGKPAQMRVWDVNTVLGNNLVPTEMPDDGRIYATFSMRLVTTEMRLTTEEGREYGIIDSSEDGYFPNDADGMIDEVRSTDRHGNWQSRRFSRELYSVLTEKYEQRLPKEVPLSRRRPCPKREDKGDEE